MSTTSTGGPEKEEDDDKRSELICNSIRELVDTVNLIDERCEVTEAINQFIKKLNHLISGDLPEVGVQVTTEPPVEPQPGCSSEAVTETAAAATEATTSSQEPLVSEAGSVKNQEAEARSSDSSDSEFVIDDSLLDRLEEDSCEEDEPRLRRSKSSESKMEKLMKHWKLRSEAKVRLLKLSDDLIEKANTGASAVGEEVGDWERRAFSLLPKEVVAIKLKTREKKKPTDMDTTVSLTHSTATNGVATKHQKKVDKKKDGDDSEKDEDEAEEIEDITAGIFNEDAHISRGRIAGNDSSYNFPPLIDTKKNVDDFKLISLESTDSESDESEEEEPTEPRRSKRNMKTKNGEREKKEVNSKEETQKKKPNNKITKLINSANRVLKGGGDCKEVKSKEEKEVVIDSDSDIEVPKRKWNKRIVKNDSDEDEPSDSSFDEILDDTSLDPSLSGSDEEETDEIAKGRKRKAKKNQKSNKKLKSDKKKSRRVIRISSGEDEKEDSEEDDDKKKSPSKRKDIRNIITSKKLEDQTREAAKDERERRKRIADKQKLYNEMTKTRSLKSADMKELVLEFEKDTENVVVGVDPVLVKCLKPHQAAGIRFMYDCTIESVDRLEKHPGSGCVLAHSMGLGKTLQVISYIHTIFTNKYTKKHLKSALIICPVNTSRNWAAEFQIWLFENSLLDFKVYEMNDAKLVQSRTKMLSQWHKHGGVLIMGYTLFASCVSGTRGKKPSKAALEVYRTCLVDPGPDIIVCDEGHLLKNDKTSYNKAVSQIRSLRRIVLTGTPLQNNLNEYFVMVNFVKPNLLGTKKEFTNRFANPITNGQHEDSTNYDVQLMKKRVHVLHKILDGSVHRCDYNVLVPYLQPKYEYVLSIKLSETQIKIYKHFLENVVHQRNDGGQRFSLLADFSVLLLLCNHPALLFDQHQRRMEKEEEKELNDDFINDESESMSSDDGSEVEIVNDEPGTSKKNLRRRKRWASDDEGEEVIKNWKTQRDKKETEDQNSRGSPIQTWFTEFISLEDRDKIEISSKFLLLFSILEECEKLGDKILLFSQSLDTLDLLEEILSVKSDEAKRERRTGKLGNENIWLKNVDYFRIDGSSSSDNRKQWIDRFNDEENIRARFFLLSTKAGSLGINLVGANRCIIFDASWNPTHDVQAIFRIFRFGQKKPVYVYRFLAQGTMEEKVYNRQVFKQSLACRVIDEQQIQRHFKAAEIQELYNFTPDERTDLPTPNLPKDKLLAELLIKHKNLIVNNHEHDSLLENRPEEELTEDERQNAWTEYEQERDSALLREQQMEELKKRQTLMYEQQIQFMQQQQQQQQSQQQQSQQQQQPQSQQQQQFNFLQAQFQAQFQASRAGPQLPDFERMKLADLNNFYNYYYPNLSVGEKCKKMSQMLVDEYQKRMVKINQLNENLKTAGITIQQAPANVSSAMNLLINTVNNIRTLMVAVDNIQTNIKRVQQNSTAATVPATTTVPANSLFSTTSNNLIAEVD